MTANHRTPSVESSLQFYPPGVEPRRCTVPGCQDVHRARGLCYRHYTDWYNKLRHQRPFPPMPRPTYTPYRLSAGQARVARLLLRGMTNAAIGRAAGISENTVKRHLGAIYAKLAVRGRREAIDRLRPYRTAL